MSQNPISAGALPQTTLGSLQRSPNSIAGFKGPTSRGGEGVRQGGEDGRERDGGVLESKKFLKIDPGTKACFRKFW